MKNILNRLTTTIFCSLTIACFSSCTADNPNPFIPKPTTDIVVNVNNVIATGVSNKYGINLNAGVDNDINRGVGARPLSQALSEMGVKHLRFPGGGKSIMYSWAAAPYTDPKTAFWVTTPNRWYADNAKNTLNFDDFMNICRNTGAIPHINVAVNPNAGLNETVAAAWVRYANITKNYGIKYWEIGNELWGTGWFSYSTSTVANMIKSYSAAMKAVDPTIKICASWQDEQGLINACGNAIDFVTISDYSGNNFNTYSNYAATKNIALTEVKTTTTKKIIASEFGPLLFQGQTGAIGDYNLDNPNNTGRGLLTFDQLGQMLSNKNCEYACFWNTRWYDESGLCSDALDPMNNLRATGKAMSVWGKFIKDKLVSVTSKNEEVVPYAVYDNATGDLNVFLVNKKEASNSVNLTITSSNKYNSTFDVWEYKGVNSSDLNPTFLQKGAATLTNNIINSISLSSTSVTVLVLKKL